MMIAASISGWIAVGGLVLALVGLLGMFAWQPPYDGRQRRRR